MSAPTVTVGRAGWTKVGKDNGEGNYVRKLPLDGSDPTRDANYEAVWYGVLAIQARLNDYLAFFSAGPQIPLTGRYGIQTKGSATWFQKHEGLKPDGVVGRITSERLWHDLFIWYAATAEPRSVPVEILWGMSRHESASFDPGAVSGKINPKYGPDRGLCQINETHIKEISLPDMFDPHEAIPYTADRLARAFVQFGGRGPDLQLNCAIAQHNSPAAAREWYEVGSMGDDTKIAEYVAAIKGHADDFAA